MEKIKITQEQEKALEYWKDNNGFGSFVAGLGNKTEKLACLYEFTPQQFALLLCGWYEVKEPFKQGDWISWFGRICKIEKAERSPSGRLLIHTDESEGHVYEEECRKATPEEIAQEKERRKWAEIGRRVNQYINGDIATTGSITRTVKNVRGNRFDLEGAGEYFAEEVTLVCPVEKRMDLKEES